MIQQAKLLSFGKLVIVSCTTLQWSAHLPRLTHPEPFTETLYLEVHCCAFSRVDLLLVWSFDGNDLSAFNMLSDQFLDVVGLVGLQKLLRDVSLSQVVTAILGLAAVAIVVDYLRMLRLRSKMVKTIKYQKFVSMSDI